MTIQLSDPDEYEGGHFQWLEPQRQLDKITQGDTTIDLNESIRTVPFSAKAKGSIVVFPSFVYHQVTPVIRGTRKSLVVWFNGQPYV
jgi:PKHD-type hydroxylase